MKFHDKDEALVFWKKIGGCPWLYRPTNGWWWTAVTTVVQRNWSEAIRVANTLPDVTFIHIIWQYVQALESALPEQLSTVTGEHLPWNLILVHPANTPSSRVYLKQAFQENSNLLEQVVEPLTTSLVDTTNKDQLTCAWKYFCKCTAMIGILAGTRSSPWNGTVLQRSTKPETSSRLTFQWEHKIATQAQSDHLYRCQHSFSYMTRLIQLVL